LKNVLRVLLVVLSVGPCLFTHLT